MDGWKEDNVIDELNAALFSLLNGDATVRRGKKYSGYVLRLEWNWKIYGDGGI